MAIAVVCAGCNRRLKAPEHLAGKRIRCPQCKEQVLIPFPEPEEIVAALPEPEPFEDEPQIRQPERSRRKQKSQPAATNHLWVLAIGCSGLLLLVGGSLVSLVLWVKLKQPGHPDVVATNTPPVYQEREKPKPPPLPPEPKKLPEPEKAVEKEPEAPPNPHLGKGRYYLRDMGFSIVQPTNETGPIPKWQPVNNNKKNPFLAFLGPKGGVKPGVPLDKCQLIIDRYDNVDAAPLDQFVAADKIKIAQDMKDMKLLDETTLRIDDRPAYSVSFSGSLRSGSEIVSTKWLRFYIAPDNQKRYVISFVALPGQFDQYRDMIEKCALSVHTD